MEKETGPNVWDDAIAQDVNAGIRAWRARVLQVLLIFSSVLLFVPLVAVWAGWGMELTRPLRVLFALVYLLLVVTALWRRGPFAWRLGVLLGLLALVGFLRLLIGRLDGSGRITLLLLPLLALVLAGPRVGWAMVGVAVAEYVAVPLLLQSGWLAGRGLAWTATDRSPAFWGLQGIFGLVVLLTLMFLFTRFHARLFGAMRAEYQARRQLEVETADRQRLEAAIVRVDEEERRRLGSDLHDGLCQHLTATLLNCSLLEKRWAEAGQPDAVALGQVRQSIADSIGMAHDVAQGLCPMDLAPDALLPALEHLCRETREHHGIQCRLQAPAAVAIRRPEDAMHWYRIAREAVANAIKHARCTRLDLTLEHDGDDLVLRICDDGPHTPPGAVPVAGLGLNILKYRAQLLGGVLTVVGGPTGGMCLTCRAPQGGKSA